MGLGDAIAKVINWKIPVVDGRDNIRTVIELMNKENVTALTVKDEKDNVIGVITDMDVMDCIVKQLELDRTKALEIMTSCKLISDKSIKSPCAQLNENETVLNALTIMNNGGVHHLLVSKNEKKVGMISISDLLQLVLD